MKFDIMENSLHYSSYLGGSDLEIPSDITTDPMGGAYLLGVTQSEDFPTTPGAYNRVHDRIEEIIVLSIADLDPPDITLDNTAASGTTGDPFEFNVSMDDVRGVVNVTVEYWFEDYPSVTKITMDMVRGTRQSGDWRATIQVPSWTTGPMHYNFTADDVGGNVRKGVDSNVTIFDNDLPGLEDTSPLTVTTGEPFEFSVIASDNIGIANMTLDFWYGDDDSKARTVAMDVDSPFNGTNAYYSYNISSVPLYSTEPLNYVMHVTDPSGNTYSTSTRTVHVIDNDAPVLKGFTLYEAFTTGDSFNLDVNFSDNIGISSVRLHIRFGDSEELVVNMTPLAPAPSGNGTYRFLLVIPPDLTENVTYYFESFDASMNRRLSFSSTVPTLDDDAPTIVDDLTPGSVIKGQDLTFSAIVDDNVGIDLSYLVFAIGDGAESNVSLGASTELLYSITVPRDASGVLVYHFVVVDASGNVNSTAPKEVLLVNSPPVVADIPVWRITEEVETRLDLTTYLSDDNDPVGDLFLTCEHPNVTVDGLSLVALFDVSVPDFSIVVQVSDGEDPVTFAIEVQIVDVNDPPLFPKDLPGIVKIIEDQPYESVMSVTDEDGDTITWSDDSPLFDIDPASGRITFTPSQADVGTHDVSVRANDGRGGEATYEFTLAVENVNDAPSIVSVTPENGSRFKEGKVVTFSVQATDEDGDELTVTWTSDGKTLGTGEILDYKKLKPGTRVVKVTVSDGNATAEEEISLVIKKSDKSPGPDFILAAFALMGGALAISIRSRRDSSGSKS